MRVFISYRRADLGGLAHELVWRIRDELVARFGTDNVAVDVATILPGEDFADAIHRDIGLSDALVVIIGPQWEAEIVRRATVGVADYVRIEIESALQRHVPIVPILVGGAQMPSAEKLPDGVRPLCRLNALSVDFGREFIQHTMKLATTISNIHPRKMFSSGAFSAVCETQSHGLLRHTLESNGRPLTNGDVLHLWEADETFCNFFVSLLRDCDFAAYLWEAAPMTELTKQRPFEFVLLNAPRPSGLPDRETYEDFYPTADPSGIAVFDNLGRDALLVIPTPCHGTSDYSGLAPFVRSAPEAKQFALWRAVGLHAQRRLGRAPMWISVAGGGITWLHIRLDSQPKYYRHAPYRRAP